MSDAQRLWESCSGTIREQLTEAAWQTTFEEICVDPGDPNEVVLRVPNVLVRDRIEKRFGSLVRDALDSVGGSGYALRLEVNPMADAPIEAVEEDEVDEDYVELRRSSQAFEPVSGASRNGHDGQTALNPDFTFEAFVSGETNRFAYAAARAAAESPAMSYNPLFVYGASGLGKTHLLHAIGNYVRAQFPGDHVKYVSTEKFLNEFVNSIRANTTNAFRQRYRLVDVLLIDDVQFLAGKEQTQDEFFHTFNELFQANKQIVLTSDTHPRAIPTLDDRLRSRFVSGLVTDVQPPELETRLAILRKKCEGEKVEPPREVLELIATHVKDNIRELEGALTRVIAYESLQGTPLTLEVAETILADILSADERRITPSLVLETASKMFEFPLEDLCGPARKRPLVDARQITMYVMRELTELSYPSIGEQFGGRDHTTVLHAVRKITDQMKEKRPVFDQVTQLRQAVLHGG
ncbi:MAG: chromosomal replication initiator protein DnaA [Acidimicrobiales bacterium]